jgi:hypothetical protein
MRQRTRNILILLAGVVLLGLAVRFIDRSETREASATPVRIAEPDIRVATPAARPPKIFRMEASLEELRKLPELDGMTRDDDVARKALPRGIETAGQWVSADDVLEGYAHPNGKRFFIIMKPGDRAYSVFLDPASSATR